MLESLQVCLAGCNKVFSPRHTVALVVNGTDLLDGPEVLPSQVFGRGTRLQVVLPGQPAEPHQLAVTVQRVPSEAQHQRRQGGPLHLGVHWDPQEQRVRRDLLQLVGRHVQSDEEQAGNASLSWN